VDATLNFKNQLRPPPAAATITQQQVDEGLPPPWLHNCWEGDGKHNPTPPPPQQVGVGGIGGGDNRPPGMWHIPRMGSLMVVTFDVEGTEMILHRGNKE